MVRPREFDETEALEKALLVFWRRGYEGTSIADLVLATGMQRQSLYNTFRDKDGLFRASLARYLVRMRESLTPLERPGADLGDLRRYMESVLELQRGEGLGACMLVKTAFGPEATHPEIRRAVEAGAGVVRARFAELLREIVARGELATKASPEEHAAFLYTVLNGLSAFVRTGGDRSHIDAILTRTFDGLGERRPERRPRRTGGTRSTSAGPKGR